MATSKPATKKLPASRKKTAQAAAEVVAKTAKERERKPASGGLPDAKPDKSDKPKKPKLVRDSFTIPKAEYAVLDDLKLRAARLGRPTKKSEVLRAGVRALAAMGDAAFLAAVNAVPALKTGRPAGT